MTVFESILLGIAGVSTFIAGLARREIGKSEDSRILPTTFNANQHGLVELDDGEHRPGKRAKKGVFTLIQVDEHAKTTYRYPGKIAFFRAQN